MFEWGSIWGNPDLAVAPPSSPGAPVSPNAPTGPKTGVIYETYTYTATTPDDPDGSVIYLMWDWGNGALSNWSGPYAEGQQIQASYTWNVPGTYAVRVKAKDVNDSESIWSQPLNVTMNPQPRLEITKVKGGLGVSMIIHNRINESVYNILWSIDLNGGLILYSHGTGGLIQNISVGQDITIKTGLIIGFGRITIILTAAEATKTASGFLLGPILLGVK